MYIIILVFLGSNTKISEITYNFISPIHPLNYSKMNYWTSDKVIARSFIFTYFYTFIV